MLSNLMKAVSGITLTFMMLLTVTDVILRYLGKPIFGSYDLVILAGAVVFGFSLPYTSWVRGHINMDFLILKLQKRRRIVTEVFTRVVSILLFIAVGIYLFKKGMYLYRSGEVSLTLQIPFSPFVFGVAVCCFIQCLVLLCDIAKHMGGEYE